MRYRRFTSNTSMCFKVSLFPLVLNEALVTLDKKTALLLWYLVFLMLTMYPLYNGVLAESAPQLPKAKLNNYSFYIFQLLVVIVNIQ